MDVSTWWRLLWAALSAGALVTLRSTFVQGLAATGKVRATVPIAQQPGAALLQLEIPKSCWTWFYLLGAGFNSLLLLLVVLAQDNPIVQTVLRALQSRATTSTGEEAPLTVNPHTIAFLSLFVLHMSRRFFESLLITQFGDSKMHVSGFFLGCLHYLSVGLSALSDRDATSDVDQTALWRRTVVASGAVLFVFASYHQSVCNWLLAGLKKRHKLQHVVPHGDWFDHVRCPLYSAEILLYVAFALVAGGTNASLYAIALWVVVNQSVSAKLNSDWYDRKFRDAELPKWKLVPSIW